MTYAAREASLRDGAPVEFVKFALGVELFRYTSSDAPQVHVAETYDPVSMLRSNITDSDEIESAKMTVSLPRDVALADLFRSGSPSKPVGVVLYRRHADDAETLSYWQGRVSGYSFKGDECEFICESKEAMLSRNGARQLYQPNCRFFLYHKLSGHPGCPVPRSSFEVVADIISVNISTITIQASAFAAKPSGWFTFGYVEWNNDTRFIINHVGDTLTLLHNFRSSPLGASVKAYAGCDYLMPTCSGKFGAHTRAGKDFGGSPLVPITNVFEKGVG